MTNLRTILARKNEKAAENQRDALVAEPRSYRDPVVREVQAANRIYKRRHPRSQGA